MTEEEVRRIVREELVRHRAIARVRKVQEKKHSQGALSQEQIAEAREKMALGLRPSEIAAALGVSRAVFYAALRLGRHAPKHTGGQVLTPDDIKKTMRLLSDPQR